MKIAVETTYPITTSTEIEIPEGKTWDDVEEYQIKWHTLHVKLNNSATWYEFDLGEVDPDCLDLKRPINHVIKA